MRIMAVDYGDARTGIAISDSSASICGDAFIIEEINAKKLAGLISGEAEKRGVSLIILGNPINMNGTAGPRSEKTLSFAELLRSRGLTVKLWDERLTSISAERVLHSSGKRGAKVKSKLDAVAASLILEGYLRSLS